MHIAHTPDDTMAQVATEKVVEAALALRDVIERADRIAARRPRICNG